MAWVKEKLVGMLLMEFKKAFDNGSRNSQMGKMETLEADRNLVR